MASEHYLEAKINSSSRKKIDVKDLINRVNLDHQKEKKVNIFVTGAAILVFALVAFLITFS
tara:strand:- start:77 stop:259 length:183 start_codon:yes stop_codon:yes gene_type:complete